MFVVLEILQAFHVGKVPTRIIVMSMVHANVTCFVNWAQSNLSLAGHRMCFQQGLYTRPWNAGHLTWIFDASNWGTRPCHECRLKHRYFVYVCVGGYCTRQYSKMSWDILQMNFQLMMIQEQLSDCLICSFSFWLTTCIWLSEKFAMNPSWVPEVKRLMNDPPELCCPISHALMEDPVVAGDGFTYERSFIEGELARGPW